MTEYKNPRFVVDVLAELAGEFPDAVAAFAGVGPETDAVRAYAQDTGLGDRIRLLGWRDDLPELMLASDLLLWPGQEIPKEGLGLGIVEAQAAGLPIIMSRSVPEDAVVIDEIVSIVPLSAGASAWGTRSCPATSRRTSVPIGVSRAGSRRRISRSRQGRTTSWHFTPAYETAASMTFVHGSTRIDTDLTGRGNAWIVRHRAPRPISVLFFSK